MEMAIELLTRTYTFSKMSALIAGLLACTPIASEVPVNESAALTAVSFRASCGISTLGYVKESESREYSIWRGPKISDNVNEYLLVGNPFDCPISFRSTNGTFNTPASYQTPGASSSNDYFEVAPYIVMGEEISPPSELSPEQMFPGSDPESMLASPQFTNCLYPGDRQGPELSAVQRILYGINTAAELYIVPPGFSDLDGTRFTVGCGRIYLNGGLVI